MATPPPATPATVLVLPPPPPVEVVVPKKKRHSPQWRDAVAGACAGACSRTLMAPVERVKLLKQLQGSVLATTTTTTTTATSNNSRAKTRPSRPLSAWAVANQVYQIEGFRAFWRGNLPNVLRVSGTAAINMTCMDYYKQVAVQPFFETALIQRRKTTLVDLERHKRLITSFVSGGLAGATGTTVLYPIEFLRTRLAMQTTREYKGMLHVLRSIVKTDGVSGLYQGYGIALAGGIFYRVIFLGGYDALKSEILHYKQNERSLALATTTRLRDDTTPLPPEPKLSWPERLVSAQFISLTAGTLSYPFDSVRRRMMMQAGVDIAERRYRNSVHCIASILTKEGVAGFYLGLGPNIVRSVGGALLLVAYDTFKVML